MLTGVAIKQVFDAKGNQTQKDKENGYTQSMKRPEFISEKSNLIITGRSV